MRKNKGQVAVGLAFGFTAVLAMFGLVFNSSMLTRDKMKLQQTTDFAAMMAAQVQRERLNNIRELNEAIELEFQATLAFLQPAFCPALMAIVGNTAPAIDEAVTQILRKSKPYVEQCIKSCPDFDQFMRDKIIQGYQLFRSSLVHQILGILGEANQEAGEQALRVFLHPENLPLDLQRVLKKRFGSLSPTMLLAKYKSGELQEYLSVDLTNENLPLFFDIQEEFRTFEYLTYVYSVISVAPSLCGLIGPGMPSGTLSTAKVVRKGNYTTSFLTGALYAPPENYVEKNFALFRKSPRKKDGKYPTLEDLTGRKLKLFRRETPYIITQALAKPFGGTFPRAANPLAPIDFEGIGEEFMGAKLIGIADREELQDFDLEGFGLVGGELQTVDEAGNVLQSMRVYREDFLH